MKRRTFIQNAGIAGAALTLPLSLSSHSTKIAQKLRFGLIADVHQDVMHDGVERLDAFVNRAGQEKMDFIMQMGDFCRPYDYNLPFMEVWEKFQGKKYHVLGNHDMDGGFTRQQTMEYWQMRKRYYSFDAAGYHFVVLDGNDPNPKPFTGYHRYIDTQQQEWLRIDLEKTDLNTLVFSHQSLENHEGVANQEDVRKILEEANEVAGYNKVLACFSGHHHTDFYTRINDIYYIQINSASYYWVGGDYLVDRYTDEINEKFPYIKYTIPYKDPLYAFVTLDPRGQLVIEGTETGFVGVGPEEMGMPDRPENDPIVPWISTTKMKF